MDTQPANTGGDAPASKSTPRKYYEARVRQSNRARYYSLQTGSVIGRAFGTWFRNLPALITLAALVQSPVILGGYLVFTFWPHLATGLGVSIAMIGIEAVVGSVLSGAVAFVVVRQLMGERASFTKSLSMGSASLIRVIGTGTLAGVIAAIGFMLLFIPGVFASCILFVAVPAALFERTGPLESLKRSAFLTKNSRLAILAALTVIGVLGRLLGVTFHVAIGAWLGHGVSYSWQARPGEHAIVFVSAQLFELFAGTIVPVLVSVVYVQLRQGKEGATVEALASIFD